MQVKGDRLSSAMFPGGATSPTSSFRRGGRFISVSLRLGVQKLARFSFRCFLGETVVSHLENALFWLNQAHTHARSTGILRIAACGTIRFKVFHPGAVPQTSPLISLSTPWLISPSVR